MKAFSILLISVIALALGCSKGSDNTSPTEAQNHAPVIQSLDASPNELPHSKWTTVTCVATDPDRDSLTYTWGAHEGELSGSGTDVEWRAPEEQGSYWVRVTVNDGVAISSDSVRIAVLANRAPAIQSITANPTDVVHGGSSTLTCTASDDDGDNLIYTWTPRSGTIQGNGASIQWRAPQTSGTYWIRVAVGDGFDVTTDSVQATVLANRPPTIRSLTANPTEVIYGENSTLTCTVTDDDGDNLTYTWTPRSGTIQGSGSSVRWEAPEVTGSIWVKVAVSDNFDSDADSIQLAVVPPNSPPARPYDPRPAHASENQPTSLTLSWSCVDPDGDPIRYDFYFGDYPPSLIQRDLESPQFRLENLNSGVFYWWKVVAHDDHGNTATSDQWEFRTQ